MKASPQLRGAGLAWQSRFVFFAAAAAVAVALLYLAAGLASGGYDKRPGAPIGQSLGIGAAVAMLLTFLYLPARRSAALSSGKPRVQFLHTLIGIAGVALALAHSRGRLMHPPALVLLAALGLMLTGVYGRVASPKRLAGAFGRAAIPYRPSAGGSSATRSIESLVRAKEARLARLDPRAREARFVLRTHHWVRRPLASFRYLMLARRERRTIASMPAAAAGEVEMLERTWRWLHIALAWLLLLGLVAHVVTTLFFAGYVAGGGQIYWWHFRR